MCSSGFPGKPSHSQWTNSWGPNHADQIRKGSGHPFYNQLNQVLAEGGFDPFV